MSAYDTEKLVCEVELSENKNDVSPEHFEWLVARRSENQKSTVDLYKLMIFHKSKINRKPELYDIAQNLTGVAFSLWRAVFLSDVTDDVEKHFTDLNKFMVSLISDNTIIYNTDKISRNWSFNYYLKNAEFRLQTVSIEYSHILQPEYLAKAALSEKERWSNAQGALFLAIAAFERAINAPFSYST